MRARFMQLLRVRHFEPALRVDKSWASAVNEIGGQWLAQARRFRAENMDADAVARLMSLETARRRLPRDSSRARSSDDATRTRAEISDQQIETFFDAFGFNPAEREQIREGFRNMGTGGMHRALPVLLGAVAVGLGGGALLAGGTSVKAGLHAARLLTQLGLAASIFYSGLDRFRTAALEDVLTHGRADAPPRLKRAPHVLRASWDAIRLMPKLRQAVVELEQIVVQMETSDRTQDPDARKALRRSFARVCHLMSAADDYKRAADNATGEFKGNERTLAVSWGTSLMYLTGMGLSILAPMKIDAAGLGGAITATAPLGLLAFVATQIAGGADKDGLEKGQRAIVNLVRHLVPDARQDPSIEQWARAYADYHAASKSRWPPGGRAQRREAALKALDETLARLDLPQQAVAPMREEAEEAPSSRQDEPSIESDIQELLRFSIHALERLEAMANESPDSDAGDTLDARPSPEDEPLWRAMAEMLIQGWKTPAGLRLEAMGRLLRGEVARTHERLLKTNLHRGPLSRPKARQDRADRLRARLGSQLSDLYHFERASREMRGEDGAPPDDGAAERAAAHLALIENTEAHQLFTGDTRRQLRAMKKSRRLVSGEALRYTLTNFGSNLVPVLLTTGFGAGDLAVAAQRAAGTYTGPQYLDFKLGMFVSTGVQPGAYISAGARASFRERDTGRIHAMLRPEQPLVIEAKAQQSGPDELLAQLEAQTRVPDLLRFSLSGQDAVEVPLTDTADNLASLYRTADRKTRREVRKAYMKMGVRHVGVGTIGVLVQPFAARRMKKSRPARQSAPTLIERARGLMTRQ